MVGFSAASTRGETRAACSVSVRPFTGLPWVPVMAVVRLSRMQSVPVPPLYTVPSRLVMPECANVESPMTPTTGRPVRSCAPASSMPCAIENDAPMSTTESTALYGATAPSV